MNSGENLYGLTKREVEVLEYIVKGYNNPQIGHFLNISEHTVHAHVSSLLYKMKVENRLKAAIKAVKERLV